MWVCVQVQVCHLASYFSRRNGAIKTEMLSTIGIFKELTCVSIHPLYWRQLTRQVELSGGALQKERVGWLYSQATHLGSPTSPSLFIIPPFNSQRISVEPSLLLFLFTFLLLVYFTVRMNRIYPRVAYHFKPNLSRRCKHRLGCDGKIQNTWCPKEVHFWN